MVRSPTPYPTSSDTWWTNEAKSATAAMAVLAPFIAWMYYSSEHRGQVAIAVVLARAAFYNTSHHAATVFDMAMALAGVLWASCAARKACQELPVVVLDIPVCLGVFNLVDALCNWTAYEWRIAALSVSKAVILTDVPYLGIPEWVKVVFLLPEMVQATTIFVYAIGNKRHDVALVAKAVSTAAMVATTAIVVHEAHANEGPSLGFDPAGGKERDTTTLVASVAITVAAALLEALDVFLFAKRGY